MKEKSHQLFDNHLVDLRDVCPSVDDIFVCPICLNVFARDDIAADRLSIGHVWPDLFRKESKVADKQVEILCKLCNNLAGGHGDAQMQLYERVREGRGKCRRGRR